MSEILDSALEYAGRGWRVHPLIPGEKRPRLKAWPRQACSQDTERIRGWWGEEPRSGVGIATGEGSGLVVLDVDAQHDGEGSLRTLVEEHGALPETWEVATPSGGRHLYFAHPGGQIRNSAGLLGPGLDVRGDGGYVVAPPTRLERGEYRIVCRAPPAAMPAWLADLARRKPRTQERAEAPVPVQVEGTTTAYGARVLERSLDAVRGATEGVRNATLARAAYVCGQYAAVLDQGLALRELVTAAQWAGLPEKEARDTASGCLAAGQANPKQPSGRPPAAVRLPAPEDPWWESLSSQPAEESPAGEPPARAEEAPPPGDDDAPGAPLERGDEAELAPLLIEDLGGWDEVVADEDTLWSWGGAGWERIEDSRARAIVVGYAGRRISRGTTTKALSISHARTAGVLAVARDLRASPGFFAAAPAGVPFRRGFLRLMDDGGLCWEDHAAEQRQRASGVLPFDPEEPGEGCREAWPKFLGATWAGCSDIDIRADLLQEWTGAALFGLAPRFKLSLLLVGPADTGKSTLLSIVESLFPAPSRTAIGLQSMASEYYRATLASSRLNVVNELPARELLDAESAKAILSGDPVEARHPAGRPFVLTCRAGHLFAANELPRTLDRALVRRLAILTCPHAVPVEKQDQRLRGRLLAELPQIAWWAVEGAQRLVRRGHYVLPESAGSAAKEWTTDSDSAAGFAEALLRRSASATSMRTIYARYRTWCEESGHRAMAASELGKRLRGLGFEEGQRRSEGKTLLAEVA